MMKGAFKLAEEITEHLMTFNHGELSAELGDRLAIMKTIGDNEVSLGGRCQLNVVSVIAQHLKKHRVKK